MKLVTFDDGLADGADGETGRTFALADVRLRAPIAPKKFFRTAGDFREHHEDLVRVDWSHPVNKGIVLFQNVDAITGPDEPIVYPGRFLSTEQAVGHIAGHVVFNDITARDIQRRERESGTWN
ncbi:fumarylacetoacetate hydrolase family protein [Streptomyces sp. NPDC056660]|uniref:fumarylacetoacetate hydrolase family protein n=1 Tax=Streptomyces sp. NPDC056660 TaxID=3345897 RepID=UPI0036A1038A